MALKIVERQLQVNESVVCADLDGEAVLLNVESGVYFGLNGLGSEIWKLLERGAAEDQIVAQLNGEYEVDPEELRADVSDFLDQLLAKGLVRAVDGK